MERKITIKSEGRVKVKPDFVVLNLTFEVKEKKYVDSIEKASDKIKQLKMALQNIGLDPECVQTESFNVRENYQFTRDRKNMVQRKDDGYICVHRLKIGFDYENERLSNALGAITRSLTEPKFDVSFTVKDMETVKNELLNDIAKSARKKAEVLCSASGGKIGRLLTVDYNLNNINTFSRMNRFDNDTCFLQAPSSTIGAPPVEVPTKEVEIEDTAVFVWEIE